VWVATDRKTQSVYLQVTCCVHALATDFTLGEMKAHLLPPYTHRLNFLNRFYSPILVSARPGLRLAEPTAR
jgi:hypothetical protein